MIGFSRAGYHPTQPKRAVIELDANDRPLATATLVEIRADGRHVERKRAPVEPWGRYPRYAYAVADFSSVTDPGLYYIQYGAQIEHGEIVSWATTNYYLHKADPDLVGKDLVTRGLDYLFGTHPDHNLSFVSAVGTRSKRVAYGNNRADSSFIAGGIVPGVLVLKPDYPENMDDWPFLWGENEYVIGLGATYIFLANAASELVAK